MKPLRALAATVLIAVAAVFATAATVSAHDQLVASTPQSGERLATAPTQVSLTFNDAPLALNGAGITVLVVDADGRNWVAGAPAAHNTTVTASVAAGMPVAGYELRWRVVSADGHPISGVIPFTIGDAVPLAEVTKSASGGRTAGDGSAGTGTAGGGQAGDAAGSRAAGGGSTPGITVPDGAQAAGDQVAQEQPERQGSPALRTIVIGAVGALVAVGVFVLIQIKRRSV